MQLDKDLLVRHASFAADGIEERALSFTVDDDRCFGLLYEPSEPRERGFVICHSYGLEFLTLRRIERRVARALASLGFAVISFHSRGYGDSTGSLAEATLDRHVQDIWAAAGTLRKETGASDLGLIGAKFGALMAGLVARSGDVSRLLMIAPEFTGEGYFRRLIRGKHMVELAESTDTARKSMDELISELERDGMLDLLGYALYGHLYKALAPVDLTTDVGSFSGDAMVVQVSKRTSPSSQATAFSTSVESRGGKCRLDVIKEPPGVTIGGPAFVSTSDPYVREDLQEPVVDRIAELVEEWTTH